uniref:Amino acid transporter transmembrane domain-containing protein n=1 Tax=Glossina austeni TaxID=7395 RepID=A0A1A9V3B8_GLOAU
MMSAKDSKAAFTISTFNFTSNIKETKNHDDEYDPFAYRDQKSGTSTRDAFLHLLKSSLGTGILAMPMAFLNAGIVFGLVGTLSVGLLCTYCVHILVQTSHGICRKIRVPFLGFAETAEKVFQHGPLSLRKWSNFAKQFVDGSLMATYYAAACVDIVFIATSFRDVINCDLDLNWHIRFYIALTLIPCLFIGQIRDLKLLVPFSAIANLFVIVTFAITLYYMFNESLVFDDKPYIAKASQLPLFFATVIFAMEGIGVVMPVENSMKTPKHFLGCPSVLNMAMLIVVTLYATIGFFGYITYGSEVRGSITLNLPYGAPLADAAKILMALAILFTFGLQFYIPNDILWIKIKHYFKPKNHNRIQILLRTIIILISGGVAAAIPNLEPFISLVGAVFFSLLGIFVPSFVETAFLWPNHLGCFKWKLIKNVILCILAILALIAGSTASIIEIININNDVPENIAQCHAYDELGWSPEYWFCVPQADENWSPSLAIYGNMGLTHAFTLPFLHDDIQQGMYDVVVHNGNFASGLNVDDGQRGDLFMKQVEAIAAYVPFMVTPGNLEEPYNFSHYRKRFTMPVHFLAFSTEVYFFTHKYGYESYCNQFDWLQHELIESDKPENRLKRPWIITYGHRPMYCSNKNDHSCTRLENEVRVGLPDDDLMGLEELFFRYGVDVQMWSHENSYERTWPLYNYTVVGGSTPDLYYEPYAPIHIITGSAGGSGERVKFLEPMPRWSAFRSKDFGYTRLKAYNKSHLYIEQFSADQRSITDHFWIIKSGHCLSGQE